MVGLAAPSASVRRIEDEPATTEDGPPSCGWDVAPRWLDWLGLDWLDRVGWLDWLGWLGRLESLGLD